MRKKNTPGTQPLEPDRRCRRCQERGAVFEAHLRTLDEFGHFTFRDVDALERHLRQNVQPWPAPEKGYDFEGWLAAVKSGWSTWRRLCETEREFFKSRGLPWPARKLTETERLVRWLDRKYPGNVDVRAYFLKINESDDDAIVKSPEELERLARELLVSEPGLLANQLAIVAAWKAHNRHDPTWAGLLPGLSA